MTRKTRYFMTGSAAMLAAGLCTGLVAYYGGGFPGARRLDRAVGVEIRAGRRRGRRLRQRAQHHGLGASPAPQAGGADAEEQGQKEFLEQTGIDIEHDIDYIVAAIGAPGAEQFGPNGLVVARGRFDHDAGSRASPVSTARGPGIQGQAFPRRHPQDARRKCTGRRGKRRHRGPADRRACVPRARSRRHRRHQQRPARHRRAAQRTEHHQQQRDDEPHRRHRPGQQRLGGRPLRPDRPNQAKLPEHIAQPDAGGQDVRRGRPHQRRRLGAVRAETNDDPAAENLRGVLNGVISLARLQGQNDPKLDRADQVAADVGHRQDRAAVGHRAGRDLRIDGCPRSRFTKLAPPVSATN